MTNPAYLLAIFVATTLLALLALRLTRRAEAAGRSSARWVAAFLATWLGVLAAAACGVRWGYERRFQASPDSWKVFVPAAVLAFAAALALAWRLRQLSGRKIPAHKRTEPFVPPPESPLPQPGSPPISMPAAPPALADAPESFLPETPAVTTFKFACPHCGQRLAVTTADVGTAAECPNCAAPLTVPAPQAAV